MTDVNRSTRAGLLILSLVAIAYGGLWLTTLLMTSERDVSETTQLSQVTAVVVDSGNARLDIVGEERTDAHTTGHVRDSLRKATIRQYVDGGTLRIEVRCSRVWMGPCGGDLTVAVPSDLRVDVSTDNGRVTVDGFENDVRVESDNGSVQITDIGGNVDVESDNGAVRVVGVTGALTVDVDNGSVRGSVSSPRVKVSSDNGSIDLELLVRPSEVEIETDNGRVDLRVPDDGAYVVDVTTDNGQRDVQVRTDPAADSRITIETDNGDVTIGYGG